MSSYYINIRMASIKRLAISCVDKALNQVKFCYTLMGMFSGVPLWKKSLHWKSTLKFLSKLSIPVSCNPEIPQLGICPRKTEGPSQENWNASAHSSFFFFFFFFTKQPKCKTSKISQWEEEETNCGRSTQ